jgi:hypothetical protein
MPCKGENFPLGKPIRNWRFALLAGLIATMPAAFPAQTPEKAPVEAPFIVGVGTHIADGDRQLKESLSVIKQAGVTSLRDDIAWGQIEKVRGHLEMSAAFDTFVDEALKAGVQPLVILDYGNRFYDSGEKPRSPEAIEAFCHYAEFVVQHFKGRVKLYEVWNEWDLNIGGAETRDSAPELYALLMQSADDYTTLIKHVYPRIKAVDPSIVVLGSGAPTAAGVRNGWLERVLAQNTLPFMDAVSVHTYAFSETGRTRGPEAWAEWMEQLEATLQKYHEQRPVPFYITETGWPTELDRVGTPPDVAATYLARIYLLARTMPFLKGIWWYDFQDDGWKPGEVEHNFGLVRPDLTPKPAYFVLADIAGLVSKATFAGRVETGDPDVWVLKFRDDSGRQTWAVWSAHTDDGWQLTLKTKEANPAPISICEAGRKPIQRAWGSRDWADTRRNAPSVPDQLEITVREMPWLISGDLDGVTVTGVKRREHAEASRSNMVLH